METAIPASLGATWAHQSEASQPSPESSAAPTKAKLKTSRLCHCHVKFSLINCTFPLLEFNSLMITTTRISIFRSSLSLNGTAILFWRKESVSPHPEVSKVRKNQTSPPLSTPWILCISWPRRWRNLWNGLWAILDLLIFFFFLSFCIAYISKNRTLPLVWTSYYYCDCFLKVSLICHAVSFSFIGTSQCHFPLLVNLSCSSSFFLFSWHYLHSAMIRLVANLEKAHHAGAQCFLMG